MGFMDRCFDSIEPAASRLEAWQNDPRPNPALMTKLGWPEEELGFANPYIVNFHFMFFMNIFYFCTLIILWYAMRGRKPFGLKNFMLLYNLSCVMLAGTSAFAAFYYIFYRTQQGDMTYACNDPTTARVTDYGRMMAFGAAIFYLQKYWEFMDTFIFMLRKRPRQVTFLHVYHHSSITFVAGMYAMYDGAGDCYLGVVLNSTVHVLMYTHYFVAAFGLPTPWKPFLTQMQLLQFVAILVQSVIAWFTGPDCGYPDFLKTIMSFYMVTMLILFGRFYIKSYLTPKATKQKSAKKND